jgi:hypothetical protein
VSAWFDLAAWFDYVAFYAALVALLLGLHQWRQRIQRRHRHGPPSSRRPGVLGKRRSTGVASRLHRGSPHERE